MEAHAPKSTSPEALAAAVIKANEAVLRGAQDGTGKPGMGTTLTAAFVFEDEATIAQVGDSRAYLLHDGQLQRITRDHSLVADLIEQGRLTEAEARFHPQRSVITRALGSDPHMQPDLYTLHVEEGDRLLLCSDGLCSMISDEDIEEILARIIPLPPTPAMRWSRRRLSPAVSTTSPSSSSIPSVILRARRTRMTSSRSASLAFPKTQGPMRRSPPLLPQRPHPLKLRPRRQHTHPRASPRKAVRVASTINPSTGAGWHRSSGLLPFILILAAAGFGFYAFAQNSYFIIAENGVVNVYRGLPGEFAGISVSWLESQAPDIDVSKLTPMVQSNLKNGISVNSLDEANEKISEFRLQTTKG